MAIEFKGVHYPKAVVLHAVFFYVRYAVSYRDLEEILAERGVTVDHATLNRWVVKFSPLIAANAQARKRATASSWRMDETYIKVRGKWTYLYRAVDRDGQTLDFMLSKRRDLAAARRFFKQAIAANGVPDRVVIDKSGANLAGLMAVNVILKFAGTGHLVTIRQVKHLNNILEQDHRFIKRITSPMMGFKAIQSAAATIAGIEVAHMIRKDQFAASGTTPSSNLLRWRHSHVRKTAFSNRYKSLRHGRKTSGICSIGQSGHEKPGFAVFGVLGAIRAGSLDPGH